MARNRTRKLNPDKLQQIEHPQLDLRRYPWLSDGLMNAYRTESGTEIYVWTRSDPDDDPDYDYHRSFGVVVFRPATGEVFIPEEDIDYDEFDTEIETLGVGMRVAAEADQATWFAGLDFERNMHSFASKPRNRVEYYRLFSWNDRNGNYSSVLLADADDIQELFEETFEEQALPPRLEDYQAIKKRLLRL
jgi:hypothetical protein